MAFKQREEGPKSPAPSARPAALTEEKAAKSAAASKSMPERLMSLDAFRGFTMLLMVSDGWAISNLVKHHADILTRYDGQLVRKALGDVLEYGRVAAPARRLDGLRRLGPDPALVHVHGRRGDAVFVTRAARPAAIPGAGSSATPWCAR